MHPGAPPPLGCLLAGGERLAVPPPQKRLLRALHGREKPSDPGEAGTCPGGTRGIPRGLPGRRRRRESVWAAMSPTAAFGRCCPAPSRRSCRITGASSLRPGGRLPAAPAVPGGPGGCSPATLPGARAGAGGPAAGVAGGSTSQVLWTGQLGIPHAAKREETSLRGLFVFFIYSVEEVLVHKSPFGNAAQLVTPPLRLAGAGI